MHTHSFLFCTDLPSVDSILLKPDETAMDADGAHYQTTPTPSWMSSPALVVITFVMLTLTLALAYSWYVDEQQSLHRKDRKKGKVSKKKMMRKELKASRRGY
jgi:hypothetical protein